MLNGSLTYVVVIIWGVWVLRGDRIEREAPARVLLSLVFAFYISRLLATTFFPFPIGGLAIDQGRALNASGFGPGNNFIPFYTVLDAAGSAPTFVSQIIGNFLLLFPLGFLAPLLFSRFTNKMNAVALVVATTFGIEFAQLAISTLLGFTYRSFDVDDLWLNAAGGILGVAISAIVIGKATWLNRAISADRGSVRPETAVGATVEAAETLQAGPTGLRETVLYRSGLE